VPVQGPDISPIQRLVLAFYAFFAILFRADVAAAVYRVREARRAGAPLPGPEHAPAIPSAPARAPAPPPEPTPTIAGPAARPAAPSTPVTAAPAPVPPPAQAPAAGQIQAKGGTAAKQAEAAKPFEPSKPAEVKPAEPAKLAEVKTPEAVKPAPEPKPVPPAPPKAAAEPAKPAAAPVAVPPAAPDPRAALQLLAVLQREGRLVDFIEEDLAGFPDASIGAAARTVHAGCKRAIEEYFRLEPVFREPEGARVTVAPGFDPSAIRLTGNVVGAPPFQGALRHHGWRAREVKLPPAKDGVDQTLVAPAEVEL
jgi:uncharacterized protein DUF2760